LSWEYEKLTQQIIDRDEEERHKQLLQEKIDTSILQQFMIVSETITGIRNIRKQKNISPKQKIKLYLKSKPENKSNEFDQIIIKLGGLESFELTSSKIDNAISFLVHQFELYIPFEEKIDKEDEKEKLQKELEYYKGFLLSVEKKLSNDKFVQSAPEKVIEMEKKKKADAEEKIKTLETALMHI
jgi:valyl-tRNA synthetase